MVLIHTFFAKNMVLDDEAFIAAATRLTELANRLETLRSNISSSLNDLRAGFDTPAGKKFFDACDNKLLTAMNNQAAVIKHVSENLTLAKSAYSSVFQEYSALNNSINNI